MGLRREAKGVEGEVNALDRRSKLGKHGGARWDA